MMEYAIQSKAIQIFMVMPLFSRLTFDFFSSSCLPQCLQNDESSSIYLPQYLQYIVCIYY